MPTLRKLAVHPAGFQTSPRPVDRMSARLRLLVGLFITLAFPAVGAAPPGIPLDALRLPAAVLLHLDEAQLEQAYRYGREHRTSPVEALLPGYLVTGENSGAWALLATPWAEAVLTGWFGVGGDHLPGSDREYLERIQSFLLVRSSETYSVTLRQGDRRLAPISESRHLGLAFAFFPLRELDVRIPIVVEFGSDGRVVDEAVWRWTGLMEGARVTPPVLISDPAHLPPLEWLGIAELDGRPVAQFAWGGLLLSMDLGAITLSVDSDLTSVTLSLPALLTGDHTELTFQLVSAPLAD